MTRSGHLYHKGLQVAVVLSLVLGLAMGGAQRQREASRSRKSKN